MIGIYKITSPSNKVYIGQSIDIDKRLDKYKTDLKYISQPKLRNSLRKYGIDNHKFEILEECLQEQLNERETYYKQLELDKINNNWDKVLFCELYDLGGGPKSKETRIKIGKGLKKVYKSKERKAYWEGKKRPKHSELMKKISGFKYKRTKKHKDIVAKSVRKAFREKGEEIGKKISQNKIGKGLKKVICNETKEIFNSLKECSFKTGISVGCICQFCKRQYPYPTLRGYTFSYYHD